MRLWLALAVVGMGGCGRFSFEASRDAPEGSIDAPLDAVTPCLVDDFNDGSASDWTPIRGSWSVLSTSGPDGSTAFGLTTFGSGNLSTHPALASVMTAHVAVDFFIADLPAGDFNVMFVQPGWTDPEMANRYDVLVVPMNGDTLQDEISTYDAAGASVVLSGHAWTIFAQMWNHLDVDRRLDGSISVALNGAPYMLSGPDTTFAGPFDVVFRYYGRGVIDNVRVDCTH